MPRYQVYLETTEEALSEGGYLAHVPALPGCVGRGTTKEAAVEKTRQAIAAYLALMRKHGQTVPSATVPIDLDIHEVDSATFPPDRAALTADDLDALTQRMQISRGALLDVLAVLPPDALDWKPDEETWAIRNVLEHIARADLWYASRLEAPGLAELLWRLEAMRQIVTGRLRALPNEKRGQVTTHNGEEWTPRKAARRVIEHEMEHLDHIQQILARYRETHT